MLVQLSLQQLEWRALTLPHLTRLGWGSPVLLQPMPNPLVFSTVGCPREQLEAGAPGSVPRLGVPGCWSLFPALLGKGWQCPGAGRAGKMLGLFNH